MFDLNGADNRKDFLIWMFFVVIIFVLPAGYIFADTFPGAAAQQEGRAGQQSTNRPVNQPAG